MGSKPPFLSISFRAMAQATEVTESVADAVRFVSGSDELHIEKVKGHFGNEITIITSVLERSGDMKKFLKRAVRFGVLDIIMNECVERLDNECILHFRLDKQMAYKERMEVSSSNDIIDVAIKVAAYPAKVEIALENLNNWFEKQTL